MTDTTNPMTLLAEKFADQEKYPRMRGTDGGMDYLVLARKPELNLQLGIKVLIGIGAGPEGSKTILVGFRLRSAPIPGFQPQAEVHSLVEGEEAEKPAVTQGNPAEGWDFPWEKFPSPYEPRASLQRLVALNRTMADAQFVMQDLDQIRFFGKMQNFLQEHLPAAEWAITDDELTDYFKVSLYEPLTAMQAQSDPAKELELLEHNWQTKKEQMAAYEGAYLKRKAELEALIAAASDGPAAYQPKAHYADELVTADSVAAYMLQGAKPKLPVVGGTDVETTEEDPAGLVAAASDDEGLTVGAD